MFVKSLLFLSLSLSLSLSAPFLSPRNVLLQGSRSEFVAKLGDLGMARVGDHYKSKPETPLPIRWCAPEVRA